MKSNIDVTPSIGVTSHITPSVSVGIDLGTTYSCAAIYKDGKTEVITDEYGNRTIPSYISFTEDNYYIGETAKKLLEKYPKSTIYNIKRIIGLEWDNKKVDDDIHNWSYQIENVNGYPEIRIDTVCVLGTPTTKYYKPEEISSYLLKHIKHNIEAYLNYEITDVVITVPAYFNDAQRQTTKKAGELAGLNVMKIINEPTAAAIAYRLHENTTDERNILVYDLGGGTLDVTVLTMDNNLLEVKATSGDTHLGGEDFDNKILAYCLAEFMKGIIKGVRLSIREINELVQTCGVKTFMDLYKLSETRLNELKNISNISTYINHIIATKEIMKTLDSKNNIARLKNKCEEAKKTLSYTDMTIITFESFYSTYDLNVKISRSSYESICANEFKRCMYPVDIVMKDIDDKIDDVVLIGGSTRMPKIRQLLQNRFGDKLHYDINPDEAVACGAAIQAGILKNTSELTLLDVASLSIGIETDDGCLVPIIKRNTHIPVEVEKYFSTCHSNQQSVIVNIYEGEERMAKDNHFLGSFELNDIPIMSALEPKIKIKFHIDTNGIIDVSAVEDKSGITNQITIKK